MPVDDFRNLDLRRDFKNVRHFRDVMLALTHLKDARAKLRKGMLAASKGK